MRELYIYAHNCHSLLMDDAAALLEIEAIKQLKARYCRLLDTKDWDAWRILFSDDFLSDTSQAGGKVIRGADEFVAFTRKGVRNLATVHQVHAPEIELTSATTARGVWALEDVVRFGPGVNLRGYGHYTEIYEKVDGRWLLTSSTLTRLREDIFNAVVSVYVSSRLRRLIGKAAGRVMK
jgi:SnoaL-like protein